MAASHSTLSNSIGSTSSSEWEGVLFNAYGALIGGADLAKVLAYPNLSAFRQAVARGTLPVSVFKIPHRRGKFAYTTEVAAWLKGLSVTAKEENIM